MIFSSFVGGSGGVQESWRNRDAARAIARNTGFVDLDALRVVTQSENFMCKPTAIQVGSTDTDSRVLAAFRGWVAMFDDNGGPGDPLVKVDGWVDAGFPGNVQWNQLVKTGPSTAVYFGYDHRAAPVVGTTFYAKTITATSGGFTLGPLVTLSGGGYAGTRVPGFGIIATKHYIEYIGSDTFAAFWDAGAPSSNVGRVQIFTLTEGGPARATADAVGATLNAGCDIIYDAINDGFHIVMTTKGGAGTGSRISFLRRSIGSPDFISLGHSVTMSSLHPSLGAITSCKLKLAPDGKVLVQTVENRTYALNYSTLSGYSFAQQGPNFSGIAMGLSRAFEFGLSDPPFDGESFINNAGGNHHGTFFDMGTRNAVREFVQVQYSGNPQFQFTGVCGVDSGGNIVAHTLGAAGLISEFPGYVPPTIAPDSLTNQGLTVQYAKRANDRVYAFHTYYTGNNLPAKQHVTIRGAVIRR